MAGVEQKFNQLNVASSIGGGNQFLIDQNGVLYRINYSTFSAALEATASAAGVAAVAAVSGNLQSEINAVNASLVAQTSHRQATSAALRDDITSIRTKHTSVATELLAETSWRQDTSAALRADITSVRTKHTSVATLLAQTSTFQVDPLAVAASVSGGAWLAVYNADSDTHEKVQASTLAIIFGDLHGLAGGAVTSANLNATSAALRSDITSIRTKHTSVATRVEAVSVSVQNQVNIEITNRQATSAVLRADITSVRTKHTSVATELLAETSWRQATSAALRADITSVRVQWIAASGTPNNKTYLNGLNRWRIPAYNGTGVLTGGVLSATTSSTHFSISDGTGIITDAEGSVTDVTWSGFTSVVPTNLSTALLTWVGFDKTGSLVQQTSDFTQEQARDNIFLGVAVHVGKNIVDAVNNQQVVAYQTINTAYDIAEAIGFVNISGNVFSANGANLNIDKSAGVLFKIGANYDINVLAPHNKTLPALTAATFQYRFSDGTNGVTGTAIDPNNLDDGAGGLTAMGVNKWSVQRIYSFISNNVKIQRGRDEYGSKALAIDGLGSDSYEPEPSIAANGLLRGWLVVKQGATDLSDPNQAQFLLAPKFGEGSAGAAAPNPGTTEFEDTAFRVYDNTDNSKKVALSVAGITTGTTRELTVQDADGVIAYTADIAAASAALRSDITSVRTKHTSVAGIVANSVARLDANNNFQSNVLTNYFWDVMTTTGAFTLTSADSGKLVYLNNGATSINLNLVANLPLGWNITLVQGGTGTVNVSTQVSTSLVNASAHTALNNQYSGVVLAVVNQEGTNSHAWYWLQGETQ